MTYLKKDKKKRRILYGKEIIENGNGGLSKVLKPLKSDATESNELKLGKLPENSSITVSNENSQTVPSISPKQLLIKRQDKPKHGSSKQKAMLSRAGGKRLKRRRSKIDQSVHIETFLITDEQNSKMEDSDFRNKLKTEFSVYGKLNYDGSGKCISIVLVVQKSRKEALELLEKLLGPVISSAPVSRVSNSFNLKNNNNGNGLMNLVNMSKTMPDLSETKEIEIKNDNNYEGILILFC